MKQNIQTLDADVLRPYEKCERFGPEALSDAELLSVLLRTGTVRKSAAELADELLKGMGPENGLLNLVYNSQKDFMQFKGIGRVKGIQLSCIAELSKRIWRTSAFRKMTLKDPSTVADYYMEDLRHCNMEQIWLMLLDTRNTFMASVLIAQGTVNSSSVSPREIFSTALKHRAAAFILVHNHPSGNADPSEEDISFSRMLLEMGEKMNIPLRDSIIIGDHSYYSFLEHRMF